MVYTHLLKDDYKESVLLRNFFPQEFLELSVKPSISNDNPVSEPFHGHSEGVLAVNDQDTK